MVKGGEIMYKVFKEQGYADIVLKNMETFAEISLGRLTPTIISLLETDGYDIDRADRKGDKSITSIDKWSLEVSDDIAKDLNELARRGTKAPVRHQTSKPKTKEPKIKPGMKVDLFDLIFNDED